MWWILGKYFTRIPLVHHHFCPTFCIPVNFWTTPIFVPKQNLIVCSRSSFQRIIQNLKIRRPLCARDWRLVHHQSKSNTSIPINCFHSIDLIWLFGYQFLRCVEHLFYCEIFCTFDGMPIVWVILLHEYRYLQCWRQIHSPYYKLFFAVFCCTF